MNRNLFPGSHAMINVRIMESMGLAQTVAQNSGVPVVTCRTVERTQRRPVQTQSPRATAYTPVE